MFASNEQKKRRKTPTAELQTIIYIHTNTMLTYPAASRSHYNNIKQYHIYCWAILRKSIVKMWLSQTSTVTHINVLYCALYIGYRHYCARESREIVLGSRRVSPNAIWHQVYTYTYYHTAYDICSVWIQYIIIIKWNLDVNSIVYLPSFTLILFK